MPTSCNRETSWSTAASVTRCAGSTAGPVGHGRSRSTIVAGRWPSTTTSSTSSAPTDAGDHGLDHRGPVRPTRPDRADPEGQFARDVGSEPVALAFRGVVEVDRRVALRLAVGARLVALLPDE